MSTTNNAAERRSTELNHVTCRLSQRLLERLDARVDAGDFATRSAAIREATELIVLEKELEARGEL